MCEQYPIIQSNGQRIYHPKPTTTTPPPRGSEIFVGNLPRDLLEDELIPHFSQVGPIYKLRLMMDFSGNTRGFAFITYYTMEDANKAISQFHKSMIRSKTRWACLTVHISLDNCRLFFGNVPKDITKEKLKSDLDRIVDGVVKVIVYLEHKNPKKNRGFAFVEFETHAMAAIARRKLLSGVDDLWGDYAEHNRIYVDWADPEPIVDPLVLMEVKIIYVKNVPVEWSSSRFKDFLTSILRKPDEIEKIYKKDNYAFVHFYNRSGAELAMKNMQTMSPFLVYSGQQMEAEWARPTNYSKKNRAHEIQDTLCLSVSPRMRKIIYNSRRIQKRQNVDNVETDEERSESETNEERSESETYEEKSESETSSEEDSTTKLLVEQIEKNLTFHFGKFSLF